MNKLILAGLLGLLMAGSAEARPRGLSTVAYTARNDGNSISPFAITVSSHLWTVVGSSLTSANTGDVSSRLRRRSLLVQTLGTVTYGVCLSSISAAASACDNSIPGYELGTTWASVVIFSEAVWYARSRAGGTTAIKGNESFDSRDETVER